jgi:hypothetical protein
MWKLKDGEDKEENLQKMKHLLLGMRERFDYVRGWEVGINFSKAPTAYDIVLFQSFETRDDLDRYKRQAEGFTEVFDFIRIVRKSRIVVDYET